jgi:superfamily II RNA helicase
LASGAGKTAIAEAAAAATLARGQRVIYTTPLKALSNQKLAETAARFGSSRCGLQTGDTSLNTEADIVIMTTEILRNIMYRSALYCRGGGGSTSCTGHSCIAQLF